MGQWLSFVPFPHETSHGCTSLVRKFCQESSKGWPDRREESGKETFWSQTLRELENIDASEIHARRLNAKEVIIFGPERV